MTDESLRAVGDKSSLASGEIGVIDVDSLRDDFLVEKMDGFLPKMKALGAGDGSGAISFFVRPTLILLALLTSKAAALFLRGRPCMQLCNEQIEIQRSLLGGTAGRAALQLRLPW